VRHEVWLSETNARIAAVLRQDYVQWLARDFNDLCVRPHCRQGARSKVRVERGSLGRADLPSKADHDAFGRRCAAVRRRGRAQWSDDDGLSTALNNSLSRSPRRRGPDVIARTKRHGLRQRRLLDADQNRHEQANQ
jgi:hypothetical protein